VLVPRLTMRAGVVSVHANGRHLVCRGAGQPGYFFRVAVAQAKGARRLRRFRVGRSQGPGEIPEPARQRRRWSGL